MISRYIFMVPVFDSRRLVAFAATKAKEVRDWGLCFIPTDFAIVIVTDDAFSKERARIVTVPDDFLLSDEPDPADVAAWKGSNSGILSNASRKLLAVGVNGAALDEALDSIVRQYVDGENALSALRDKYPDNWEAVRRLKSRKESLLALEFPATVNTSISVLGNLVANFQREIVAGTPGISESLAAALAWAAVADWLLRCPLELAAP